MTAVSVEEIAIDLKDMDSTTITRWIAIMCLSHVVIETVSALYFFMHVSSDFVLDQVLRRWLPDNCHLITFNLVAGTAVTWLAYYGTVNYNFANDAIRDKVVWNKQIQAHVKLLLSIFCIH